MQKRLAFLFALMAMASLAFAQGEQTTGSVKGNQTPQPVATTDAPPASGPYSQAIKAGAFVFVAGQVPHDPATNKVIEGDITAQTDRVLKNIAAILTAAGTSLDRVVRTTVYLKNVADFAKMNEVYATYFKTNPPARSTIGVADLPAAGALVEIDVVALQGSVQRVAPRRAPGSGRPFP
jgi:2-iminobutanoate/2-iminopropanoate deaminase